MKDSPYDDEIRRSFLDALDTDEDINPTEWEIDFLQSTMERTIFSEKQRMAIDRMIENYGDRLGF